MIDEYWARSSVWIRAPALHVPLGHRKQEASGSNPDGSIPEGIWTLKSKGASRIPLDGLVEYDGEFHEFTEIRITS
jgi:hypothetical protein